MSESSKRFVLILQGVYLLIFLAFLINAFTVDVLLAPPALAILRFPSNLRGIGEAINAPWTQNLRHYHILLLVTTVIGAINLIGLSSLQQKFWRTALRISSFFGFFILWSAMLFFLSPFLIQGSYSVNYLQAAMLYAGITFAVFLVNLATFAVAIRHN